MFKIKEYLGNVQVIDAEVITTFFCIFCLIYFGQFYKIIYVGPTYSFYLHSSVWMVMYDELNMN